MHAASARQVEGHAADDPSHRYGEHAGLPLAPAERMAHVPSVLAPVETAQASHAPLQAVSQHTLSTQ